MTYFLCYDTCTTIAQTLRYLQIVSRIHELMMKLKLWATSCCKTIYIYIYKSVYYSARHDDIVHRVSPYGRLEVSAARCTQQDWRSHCNASHHKKCLLRAVLIYMVFDLTTKQPQYLTFAFSRPMCTYSNKDFAFGHPNNEETNGKPKF